MKYPMVIWQDRPWFRRVWRARVSLNDIPLAYYPGVNCVGESRDRHEAIDKAVKLRHQALLNFEAGRRQDKQAESLEVEVDLPPVKRGPVWR